MIITKCESCNNDLYCSLGNHLFVGKILQKDETAVKTEKIDEIIRNIRCEQSNSCLDDSVANVLVKMLENLKKGN